MSAYIIIDISVHDAAMYDEYKLLAPPSIAQYGGRYLARGGATTVLEGDWAPTRLVILEFPTAEQAQAWCASPEYAPGKAVRQKAATARMVLVEGLPGLPL